eukprot:13393853-Alexandrium_andersonii.AAC.1
MSGECANSMTCWDGNAHTMPQASTCNRLSSISLSHAAASKSHPAGECLDDMPGSVTRAQCMR